MTAVSLPKNCKLLIFELLKTKTNDDFEIAKLFSINVLILYTFETPT